MPEKSDKSPDMENKLQELTRKIYDEGIGKAQKEAELIIANANKQAETLTGNARKEAEEILKKAHQAAEDLERNTRSELQMSAKQAISAIRQQIAGLITAKVVDAPVKEVVSDKAFMGDLIQKALENFSNNAVLVLPAADEKALASYFGNRLNQVISSGVEIRFDEKVKGG